MKKYLLLWLLLAAGVLHSAGQGTLSLPDSASFLLHKFAQPIGKETYTLHRSDSGLTWTINFRFVDRGSPVPLTTVLSTTEDFEPLRLRIKGNTSRMSTIDDSIHIRDGQVGIRVDDSLYTKPFTAPAFPVGGYSPGTVQMILLQYWKRHHQPASVALLPTGTATIALDGRDTLTWGNKPLYLERFVIGGLIWGNEIVWTDTQGNLVCLITNDAEGDKVEMMQESFESLLPVLITKAAVCGMRLFTSEMGMRNLAKTSRLAITGARLIDVNGGPGIQNSVVLIKNGKIEKIGRVGELKVPAGTTIIHGEGKSLLPGLWDMHAHFEQAEWGPAYLASGVTTVRDCGNEFEYINAIQQAIDEGRGIGPHILKAGIIDGPGPNGIGIIRAANREEAIAAVRRYKDNGFVQIKIYSSVQAPIVRVICDEAHRLGLTVTGHIPDGMNLIQGVDSGMDMVNHIPYVTGIMKRNKDRSIDLQDSVSQAALQFLKAHRVVIDPTLGVYEMMLRSVKEDITRLEPAFYTLPLPLQVIFKDMGMPEDRAQKFRPMMTGMLSVVKALHDQGVPIVAGTDMGFPGYSVCRELELYVNCGLSPLEAIQTATIVPARVLHQDQRSGSIEAGRQADLLLVDGDPLQHISDLRRVVTVIKDGQVYDPNVLHRMVGYTTAAGTPDPMPGSAHAGNREQQLDAILKDAFIPGMQLIHTKGDRTERYNTGVDGDGSDRPVSSATIFQAASLSKSVFAYLVLRLYDRGLIDLDRPLLQDLGTYGRFDPKDPRYAKITARMVLRHTTGLPNWGTDSLASLLFTPDSCFSYSGEGYVFLQRVVEKKMKEPLNALMQREVFTPLEMRSSSFVWIPAYDSLAAFGRTPAEKGRRFTEANAAYSLLTNAGDYNKFLQAILRGTGLKKRTYEMMLETSSLSRRFGHAPDSSDKYISWGLGVGLQQNQQGTAIWHWGDNGDFKALYMAFPAKKESLLYFTHSRNGLNVAEDVLNLFLGPQQYWVIPWLSYGYDAPLVLKKFRATLEQTGFSQADAVVRDLSARDTSFHLTEHDLNQLGYLYLSHGDKEKALSIFALNTRLFPNGFNTWDSQGEALAALGQTAQAIASYQRSLDLNPENKNAADQIHKLYPTLHP